MCASVGRSLQRFFGAFGDSQNDKRVIAAPHGLVVIRLTVLRAVCVASDEGASVAKRWEKDCGWPHEIRCCSCSVAAADVGI